MRRFLTAQWRDLVTANYEVAPEILLDFVPRGVAPDFRDDRCFVVSRKAV